jgi:acetyl esterase/lipase
MAWLNPVECESPFVFKQDTPPVFLVHATNDGITGGAPIELPRAIKADLEKLGVPVKMHEFDEGAHGVGISFPSASPTAFRLRSGRNCRWSGSADCPHDNAA